MKNTPREETTKSATNGTSKDLKKCGSRMKKTDLTSGELGPNGFPIAYNRRGDKIELIDDDEHPGVTVEHILRRGDRDILDAEDEYANKVWLRRCGRVISVR